MNRLPRPTPVPRTQSKAFTLIELLTVIAIIGILAAIIIPTVSKVRATAKKAQCVSNLRQWGTATRLMANDHKGVIPLNNAIGTGQSIYSRYFGQLNMVDASGEARPAQEVMSRCPSDPITDRADPEFRGRGYTFGRPIGYKSGILGEPFGLDPGVTVSGYNVSAAQAPSQLLLMAESHSLGGNHAYLINDPQASWLEHVKPMQVNTDSRLVRHAGSANILFLDGHVTSYTSSQTDFGVAENRPRMIRWFTLQ